MMPGSKGGPAHDDKGGDMNGRKVIVLLLAVLALAAAGCGGDDSTDASGDTDTAVVEETTTEDTTAVEEDTTEETSGDEDVSALGGKCTELAGIGAKFSQATASGDAGLEQVSKLFDELADNVPEEIKDDFQVLAENYSKLAEAMKGVDLSSGKQPSAEDLAKMQKVTASLNSPEIQQASKNISDWVTENC
jgi:hypothetical protein